MKISSIENAEHYIWGEGCDGWHLVQPDSLSVFQERMPPGCSEKMHLHQLRNDQNAELTFTATSTPPSHGDSLEQWVSQIH
jgi:hypothetical protein